MIEIRHLKKTFTERKQTVEAVKDVSFSVNDNEIFALLGPNGAGKTTTMRMVSTLLKPSGGTLMYNGRKSSDDILSLRKNLGFLTNEIRLDGQFSPDELGTYYGRLYGMKDEDINHRKEKLFGYFGITPYKDRRYEEFSTGMKQKTSIAVCLIHDPHFILFDEPTNGLDILTQLQVEDIILKLRNEGKCIIVSTHILGVVEKLADRVGVIVDGKSVFEGTRPEMISATGCNDIEEAFVSLYKENHVEKAIDDRHTKRRPIWV